MISNELLKEFYEIVKQQQRCNYYNEDDFISDTKAIIKKLKERSRQCTEKVFTDEILDNDFSAYWATIDILKKALRVRKSHEQHLMWWGSHYKATKEYLNQTEKKELCGS